MDYYEYKFLVPNEKLAYVTHILDHLYGFSDPFPEGEVDSIYYDTPDRRCFQECLNGEMVKRKFRVRGYGDGRYFQLHQKHKELSGVSKYKSRIQPVTEIPAWDEICVQNENDPSYLKIHSLADNYGRLIPAVRVKYKRKRYRLYDYRMTLDYNIEVFSCGHDDYQTRRDYGRLPHHVLEIKTTDPRPHLPFLGLIKLEQVSFSKFYLGIVMLDDQGLFDYAE